MPTTPDDVALAQLRERLVRTGADPTRLAEFDRLAPTIGRTDGESTAAWSLRTLAIVAAAGGTPTVSDQLLAAGRELADVRDRLAAAVPPGGSDLAERVSLVRAYLGMAVAQLHDAVRLVTQ